MQFDTSRLCLVKIVARVVELKTKLKIQLPSSAPDQAIFAMLLGRRRRFMDPARLVLSEAAVKALTVVATSIPGRLGSTDLVGRGTMTPSASFTGVAWGRPALPTSTKI